jgi:hypothetical protein
MLPRTRRTASPQPATTRSQSLAKRIAQVALAFVAVACAAPVEDVGEGSGAIAGSATDAVNQAAADRAAAKKKAQADADAKVAAERATMLTRILDAWAEANPSSDLTLFDEERACVPGASAFAWTPDRARPKGARLAAALDAHKVGAFGVVERKNGATRDLTFIRGDACFYDDGWEAHAANNEMIRCTAVGNEPRIAEAKCKTLQDW